MGTIGLGARTIVVVAAKWFKSFADSPPPQFVCRSSIAASRVKQLRISPETISVGWTFLSVHFPASDKNVQRTNREVISGLILSFALYANQLPEINCRNIAPTATKSVESWHMLGLIC